MTAESRTSPTLVVFPIRIHPIRFRGARPKVYKSSCRSERGFWLIPRLTALVDVLR